jgi:hypothetical protein
LLRLSASLRRHLSNLRLEPDIVPLRIEVSGERALDLFGRRVSHHRKRVPSLSAKDQRESW